MNLRSPRAPRRRHEARDLFRNGILEAAEEVFAERGYDAARIRDIARRARIGVGTVYNHFAKKDDVLAALVDDRTDALVACLQPADDDPRDYRRRLTARLARVLDVIDHHRGFYALLLTRGLEARRSLARLRAAELAVVDEGLAAGALAPLARERLALFFAAVLSAAVEARVDDAAEVTRLFLDGARRRPA
jgi:AcrR family transcriptional regulator